MISNVKNKNYTFRYIVATYIVFWLGILILGGLYLLLKNDIILDLSLVVLSWTPTIVLLIMFNKLFPNTSRKEWIKKSFSSKINFGIVVITCVAFILTVACTYLILFFKRDDVLSIDFNLSTIGFIVLTIISSIITGATGEELGWRGYLQGYYEENNNGNIIKSALKVALVWTFWHTPLWFMSAGGEIVFLVNYIATFIIENFCLSIIIAICYNRCKNIFIPMWIHFLSNFTMSLMAPYFSTNASIIEGKWWLTLFYLLITTLFIIWHQNAIKRVNTLINK